MLLLKLLRYIRGYAVFEAEYGFPERFVNLCTSERVPVWNIQNKSGILQAHTTADSIDSVKEIAEKSGMQLNIIRISSLKDTLKRHKSRKGLIIALALCFLMSVFFSFFIWSISVEGNERYTNEEILAAFEKQGVKIGAPKGKIDTRKASENAESLLPDLSWAKVNIRGCFAVIEVRESIRKPVLLDEESPVNIVAAADGQIIRYEVSKGEPILKSGIAVTKGDLLVSGVLTNQNGSERLVHAKAFVTAKVSHIIKPVNKFKLYSLSDEEIKKSIFFFGITMPDYKNDEIIFESREYLNNGKRILPAGIFRYRSAEYKDEYELSQEQALLLNAFRFNKTASEIYENAEDVIKADIRNSPDGLYGEFISEQNIGQENEILIGAE